MKIVFHYLTVLSSGNRVYYYPGEERSNWTRLQRLIILSEDSKVLTAVCGKEAEKLYRKFSSLEGSVHGSYELNPSQLQLDSLLQRVKPLNSDYVKAYNAVTENLWVRISPAVAQSNREGIANGACDEIETYYLAIGMPGCNTLNSRAQIEVLYILGTHLHLMGKQFEKTFFSCRGESRDTGVHMSTPYYTGKLKSPAVYLRAAITNALKVQSR